MTSAFKKHDVHYLSASTINLWISQPAMCLLKIAGLNDGQAGAPAWRGTAVDRAVTQAAFEPKTTKGELVQQALKIFDEEHSQSTNRQDEEKVRKERDSVIKYVEHGADFYRQLNQTPIEAQGKVKINLDDIDVPYYGYFDLLYEDKVRDTKTSARAVNSLTAAASRQVSIYGMGTGREPWIDYVTTKGVQTYKVERPDYWLRQVQIETKGLERVLSFSDDILECCQLVYPDLDHWMWSDGMKAIARDIWQMENHDENK